MMGAAAVSTPPASHAQSVTGTYTRDSTAYFIQGSASIQGSIPGYDVMVGKNNTVQWQNVSGAALTIADGAYIEASKHGTHGGAIGYQGVYGWGDASINMTGGEVIYVQLNDTSTMTMAGGYIHDFFPGNTSVVTMTGGYIDTTTLYGESSMVLNGGVIGRADGSTGGINNFSSANVDLYGYDLTMSYQSTDSCDAAHYNCQAHYYITGRLQNESAPMSFYASEYVNLATGDETGHGKFILHNLESSSAPEPASFVLLAFGTSLGVCRIARRRR